MPSLPTGLKPTATSYAYSGPGGVARTEVAGGMSRQALEFDRGSSIFNITFVFTPQQFAVWSLFFLRVIKKGALPFDGMPIDSGLGVQAHTGQIVAGSYQPSRNGELWIVAIQFEAISRVYEMTDTEVAFYLELHSLYGAYLPSFFDRLSIFANIDVNALDF